MALSPFLGRVRYQPIFRGLLDVSLRGMNYGGGQDVHLSGERFVLAYVTKLAARQSSLPVVLDVGAHHGNFARAAAAAFGDRSRIWALEPSPTAFAELERSMRVVANVMPVNVGLSDREERDVLVAPTRGSKLASLHGAALAQEGRSPSVAEPIRLTTLDSFCESHSIEHVQLLKLDVEGHELAVLTGAAEMLGCGRINFIQFEFGAWNVRSRTYLRDFFELLGERFRICRVLRDGISEVPRYSERHEIFTKATNYLAVRRDLDLTSPELARAQR
jgi:FkbM family methyltransferase